MPIYKGEAFIMCSLCCALVPTYTRNAPHTDDYMNRHIAWHKQLGDPT